jgi:hypothetical protein
VSPRSQVASIGAEREIGTGLFLGADYVHQHWTDLDRTVDLNAPSVFDRTAPGQVRSVAAANATRPILPVNGGVRSVNVLMNVGVADYDGLQTQFTYRRSSKMLRQSATHCRKRRTPSSRTATGLPRARAAFRRSARPNAGRAFSTSAIAR